MKKDAAYAEALARQKELEASFIQEKKREREIYEMEERARHEMGPNWWGEGYSGYGNGVTGTRFRVVYPKDKKRYRRHRDIQQGSRSEVLRNKHEELVPIRIELEHEGAKIKETFAWNIQDKTISTDLFAEVLCEDFHLPSVVFIPAISRSIQEQISEYHGREWRVKQDHDLNYEKTQGTDLSLLQLKEEIGQPVEYYKPIPSALNDELRISIRLDITVGVRQLTDQIEWDINNSDNQAEEFAHCLATELGLGGEFTTAIAHSIREQSQIYTKSLVLTGHSFDGTPVLDEDLKMAFLPPIVGPVTRIGDIADEHTPRLIELSDLEVDRLEKDRERESRRKRRQTRGRRGVLLPDREPLPTRRTIPSRSSSLLLSAFDEDAPTQPDPTLRRRRPAQPIPQHQPSSLISGPPATSHANHYHTQTQVRGPLADPARTLSAAGKEDNVGREALHHPPTPPSIRINASSKDSPKMAAKATPYVPLPEQIQHDNFINGVWHCGNCGCPQSVAVGLRKGPRGDRTLCGACGKYFHRHRKSRPVGYNIDEQYHQKLRQEQQAQAGTRRKLAEAGNRSGLNNGHQLSSAAQAMMMKGQTPQPRFNSQINLPSLDIPRNNTSSPRPIDFAKSQQVSAPRTATPTSDTGPTSGPLQDGPKSDHPVYSDGYDDDDHSLNPYEDPTREIDDDDDEDDSVDDSDDDDDDDLIRRRPEFHPQTVSIREGSPEEDEEPNEEQPMVNDQIKLDNPQPESDEDGPPQWLEQALQALLQAHPTSNIELVIRSDGDYRIRCVDCPGKLYTPGPQKTLANFEIHLKNRMHKANVEERMRRDGA